MVVLTVTGENVFYSASAKVSIAGEHDCPVLPPLADTPPNALRCQLPPGTGTDNTVGVSLHGSACAQTGRLSYARPSLDSVAGCDDAGAPEGALDDDQADALERRAAERAFLTKALYLAYRHAPQNRGRLRPLFAGLLARVDWRGVGCMCEMEMNYMNS